LKNAKGECLIPRVAARGFFFYLESMPVRVKICGITNIADAEAAARCGADALGFNFYARSPRYLPEEKAAGIIRALPPFVEPVALFVNELTTNMIPVARRLERVFTIQYHGDQLPPCPAGAFRFIPAFAVKDADSLGHITLFVERCRQEGQLPAAVLVDAHVVGAYGGTGQTAPWHLLAGFEPGAPVILAGGLTPDNVAEAIRVVRPYAVDVAGGVEKSPGHKDVDKMRRFIDNAYNAA
jgi:phosphoribosylanthranilate isomerase